MKRIPITLITGFLGSGKSTLINRIISENKDKKIGLILNEFGDVQLESNIVQANKEEIVELSNGCMCCVVRSDLIKTVDELIKKKPEINYIIIEASGLSDPVPIAQTFLMQDMDKRIRLDSILCVVDAVNFEKNSEHFDITVAQLRFADIILISKTDLVEKIKVDAIKELITDIVPKATIFENKSDLDLDLLIDTSSYSHDEIQELEIEEHNHEDEEEEEHEHHDHDHEEHECEDEHCENPEHNHKHHEHKHEHVDTLFFKTIKPFDQKKFESLIGELPEAIVRAKGFVNFGAGMLDTKMKYILQIVGARKQFTMDNWKPREKKQTALVFIGKHFDKKDLEQKLKNCEV
ncbi:MAG TPA: GTP-binding protein [Candidatus Nanoarchaeia archaeon]|nr:GTP-binding protein [Candidatus Nanoarchaeia archaeon]